MRLYGHSQDLARAMPLIRRMRPEYWKVIDPDSDSAKECSELGVKLIVKHYGPWDNGNPRVVEPEQFVDDCKSQLWFPWAWAIETPNEPHVAAPMWMARCNEILNSLGKECVVGNWGTGWDGYHVPGATYYGCHEYGWPFITSQSPWHADRYRDWFEDVRAQNPNAKLFMTEMGVTQAVEGRADVGWKSGDLDPSQYWASLVSYSFTPEHVLAGFLYQVGGNSDWETFEVLGTPIEDWMAELSIDPPRYEGTTPEHEEDSLGPSLQDSRAEQFDIWWNAGGWRNFASYLVATGQVEANDVERRDLVLDRLESSVKEAAEFLRGLPLPLA